MNIDLILIKLHPASVHFPIAFLLLASLSGLLYLYWRQLPLLISLCWTLMFLGWIGAIVACLTGLLAQRGLPPQPPYGDVLNLHITTGLAQIVAYGTLLYQRWRYPIMTKQREKRMGGKNSTLAEKPKPNAELLDQPAARWWITLLLLLGMGFVVASGWNGGRLVFEWGVNVVK